MAQWLRLHAANAGGPGSIPGQGPRSYMHAATKTWRNQVKKKLDTQRTYDEIRTVKRKNIH